MAKLVSGQLVYVNAKNCKLLSRAMPDAPALAVLQPKTTVIWLAQSPNSREFHQVRYGNLTGFIYYFNLQQKPVIGLPISDPFKCPACQGLGHVEIKGMNVSQWGNNFVHPNCPKCKGAGRIVPTTAFASDGTATKA
jgi:hypothetical protein